MEGEETPGQMPVSELVEDNVVRAAPGLSLVEVAEILSSAEVGVVVLSEGGKAVAVVSERDLVRAVAERRDPTTTHAIDVGNTSLIWCDVTATVAEVAAEMMDRYVRHILVEENGALIGVVSARDLLGAYASGEDDPL